jgi:hypothetical protein
MWPLRQNVQYNKQYFFKDIFLFVFAAHLILLGVLFVCESGKFHQERFVIDTKSLQSTVVFMPLQKRVPESKIGAAGSKNNGARKVMSHDEYQKKLAASSFAKASADKDKKNKPKKIKKIASKKAVAQKQLVKPVEKNVVQPAEKKQPVKKSPTMLQTSSLAAKKKLQTDAAAKALKDKIAKEKATALAKAAAEKAKKALAIKSASSSAKATADKQTLADKMKADKEKIKAAADKDKKLADQKTLEEKNKKIDKIEPVIEKQVEIVHEIPEQIILPKIEPVVEKLASQVVEKDQSDDNSLSAGASALEEAQDDEGDDDEDDLDNISFVGSRDLEMMHIKEQIQAEIIKYYKPPVGISKKAVCELSALVGPGGKATRVVVKKGSGSMANDVCARAALLKVTFPKEVIGREITIALGQ